MKEAVIYFLFFFLPTLMDLRLNDNIFAFNLEKGKRLQCSYKFTQP